MYFNYPEDFTGPGTVTDGAYRVVWEGRADLTELDTRISDDSVTLTFAPLTVAWVQGEAPYAESYSAGTKEGHEVRRSMHRMGVTNWSREPVRLTVILRECEPKPTEPALGRAFPEMESNASVIDIPPGSQRYVPIVYEDYQPTAMHNRRDWFLHLAAGHIAIRNGEYALTLAIEGGLAPLSALAYVARSAIGALTFSLNAKLPTYEESQRDVLRRFGVTQEAQPAESPVAKPVAAAPAALELEIVRAEAPPTILVRVRNTAAKTAQGVEVRIDAIESLAELTHDELRHLRDLIGLPLMIFRDIDRPPRRSQDVHVADEGLFELASNGEFLLRHAIGQFHPMSRQWTSQPTQRIPDGRYNIRVRAQGRDVAPVTLSVEIQGGGKVLTARTVPAGGRLR